MFHTYFNPIKKSFEFCYAFSIKVSVVVYNLLIHSGVPTDTLV